MEFYPLAEYCNGLIATFNEFRLCSPVALSQNFTKLMQESLSCVAKAMLFFYKQEQQVFFSGKKQFFFSFPEICFPLFFGESFFCILYILGEKKLLSLAIFLPFQAFTANERENMLKFVECLSEQLIPYVQFCIHALFPANQIAMHLEISPIQSQKEVNRKEKNIF